MNVHVYVEVGGNSEGYSLDIIHSFFGFAFEAGIGTCYLGKPGSQQAQGATADPLSQGQGATVLAFQNQSINLSISLFIYPSI